MTFAVVPSPSLAALQKARDDETVPVEWSAVPFEFVMDRVESPTLNALLAKRRVIDQAKPLARVFLRHNRFHAEVYFEKPPGLILALDLWAWENKR